MEPPPSNPPYPAAIALAVLSTLAILLDLPPLVWHCKNRNVAAGCLISWLVINNLLNLINACIWPNDDTRHLYSGEGLCDIEVKLIVARSTALPGATFCILKSLADVMDTSKVNLAPSKARRVRALVLDLFFGLGVPALTMFLHYVVQPSRYYLTGVSGCVPSFYPSPLTVLLLDVPPVILTIADVYLCSKSPSLPPNHLPHPSPVPNPY